MNAISTPIPSHTWISATWDEYLHHTQNRPQTKGYYYKNHLRLEMSQFFEHGKYHVAIIFAVNLFATLKGIPATGLDTTTPIF